MKNGINSKINILFFITALLVFFLISANPVYAAVDCTDTATTGVTQIECEALVAIYNNTVGTGWTNKTNWDTASAVSTWYGITVSGGHVTAININSNNVKGSFPTEIGNLTYLTTFNMYNNWGMAGSIPASIGNLTDLITLGISADSLSGTIPVEMCNLTKSYSVLMHANNFSGSIPSCFSNWYQIALLYLYSNDLTGSIPSGLSDTLANFRINDNQLSGPVPSDLANNAFTAFHIQDNKFVFSDFESDYAAYVARLGVNFTYNTQAVVDTVRTVTTTAGDTLTITPSVAANTNDVYQWYKGGVAIDGATSRVYTKTALDTDAGTTYTYRITNSVITDLTLQSNNITVAILPNPPTTDSIYYIIDGVSTWVRGAISGNKDIAQQYYFNSTNNTNLNFGGSYIISSTTANATSTYITGTSLAGGSGDDSTPINTGNVGYFSGNHGLVVPVVTSVGHDKTSADVGSTWSDGTYQFILTDVSGNNLTFYSVPSSSPWAMQTSVLGTLTHVSGATHTVNITVSSQTTATKYPIITNISHQVLVNGTSLLSDGDAGYADYVDIIESFDVIDPSAIVRTNNPWDWDDATSTWMHVTSTFRAYAGQTIVHSVYEIFNPVNLGYIGVIQVGTLVAPDYDHQYFYIPKTKPVDGYDFESIQLFDSAPTATIYFDSDSIDNITNPPDRQIILEKRDEDSNYDIGFAFGYSPYGSTATSSRDAVNYWFIHTSKKTYPEMVGGVGVVDDVTYDAYAYRQWIDPTQYAANKLAYWNTQNGHELVYIDYHESVTNDVTTLPSKYYGKAVKIIDSLNINTPAALIGGNGSLTLSTTGANTYGYAVLELMTPPSAPTSPTFSTASATSSLVANWVWGGSSGDTNYTLDISAPNDCTSFTNFATGISTSTISYTITGLSANNSYCFRVAATSDSLATSAYTTSSAKYTLANVPSASAIANSTSQITVSWTGDATEYYAANTTVGTNSGWTSESSHAFVSLSCGTTYAFTVKAKNGDSVETNLATITKSTLSCSGAGLPSSPSSVGSGSVNKTVGIDQVGDIGIITTQGVNYLTYINSKANFEIICSRTHELESHSLSVVNFDLSIPVITLSIQSVPQIFNLRLSEFVQVDLDGDKIKDLEIKFTNLWMNRAELTMKSLLETRTIAQEPSTVISTPQFTTPMLSKDLKFGYVDFEVKLLQQFLKDQGYFKYQYITTYFGNITKTALISYQKSKQLNTTGILDKPTRDVINGNNIIKGQTTPTKTTSSSGSNSKYIFKKFLSRGNVNSEVKELQNRLQELGFMPTTITPNGVFGPATQVAVIKLQKAHNLKPPAGFVGPGTRKVLNGG